MKHSTHHATDLDLHESPATCRRLILTLVDDDLNDKTHRRMDDQVVVDVATIFGDNPPSLVLLLMSIVGTSEGKTDAKYQLIGPVGALMKEYHPDLADKLQGAWEKRSFPDIRRLCAFFYPD